MHRTLKEQTALRPSASIPEQQRRFDAFRAEYNDRRLHEALGQKPPASCYEPSRRVMPETLRVPEYGDDFKVRRVNSNGYFGWNGERLFAGNPLASQLVGIRQTDEDDWELHYGPIHLGYILVRGGKPAIEPLS